MSLEEMMEHLSKRIISSTKTTFNSLTSGNKNKAESIVSFLALLELAKNGDITIRQENDFDDIHIESDMVDTHYFG